MTELAVGVDIGGTKIAVGVVDASGRLVGNSLAAPTPARDGADAILAEVTRLIEVSRALFPSISRVGIGSAGVFDHHGSVSGSTDILRGWTGTPVSARVAKATGLPVVTVNDVQAAAIGEHAVGAAAGVDNVLVVAVGTGVGGALIQGGYLVQGTVGVAGSIGHTAISSRNQRRCSCGRDDHVEPHASGPGVERTYLELTGKSASLREISVLAREGDHPSIDCIELGAAAMGAAIASAINLLDPSLVLVGGGVAAIGDLYLDALRKSALSKVLPTASDIPIAPTALGTQATIIGSAILAHRSSYLNSDL